jgi:hypothetical protein
LLVTDAQRHIFAGTGRSRGRCCFSGMDKLSSMYRARYEEAEQHAVNGNNEKALDICRELRLRPELSHYRRPYVNLLIATLVDIRTHPDCDRFARECIELVEHIRQTDSNVQKSEAALASVEAAGRTTLAQVRQMQYQLPTMAVDDGDFEEVTISDKVKALLEGLGTRDQDAEETDRPNQPWTIEECT